MIIEDLLGSSSAGHRSLGRRVKHLITHGSVLGANVHKENCCSRLPVTLVFPAIEAVARSLRRQMRGEAIGWQLHTHAHARAVGYPCT